MHDGRALTVQNLSLHDIASLGVTNVVHESYERDHAGSELEGTSVIGTTACA